jgi:hypothetical protein
MKAKTFKLVLAALLLLLIGSSVAFADGSKRHPQPSYSGHYHQLTHYDHHPNYYHYNHWGPPVRSYYHYNYCGSGYGNCRPGYGGNSSYFSGFYYVPGFRFSFGAFGR